MNEYTTVDKNDVQYTCWQVNYVMSEYMFVYVQDVKSYSTTKGFIAEDLIRNTSVSSLMVDENTFSS